MSQSKLVLLMNSELPTISQQKRKQYKTNLREVKELFSLLNQEIFNNKLDTPKIIVKKTLYNMWANCSATGWPVKDKTKCTITIQQNWFCIQWLIMVLAHEMCHQYQWDIIGKQQLKKGKFPVMSHGPSFFVRKKQLLKFGIPLKRVVHSHMWFSKQNLLKC